MIAAPISPATGERRLRKALTNWATGVDLAMPRISFAKRGMSVLP
jgi:hypothetical protein